MPARSRSAGHVDILSSVSASRDIVLRCVICLDVGMAGLFNCHSVEIVKGKDGWEEIKIGS